MSYQKSLLTFALALLAMSGIAMADGVDVPPELLERLERTEQSVTFSEALRIPEKIRTSVSETSSIEEINTFYHSRGNIISTADFQCGTNWDAVALNSKFEPFLMAKAIRTVINKDPAPKALLAAKKHDFRVIKLHECIFEDDVWPPPCDIVEEVPGLKCESLPKHRQISLEVAPRTQNPELVSGIDYLTVIKQYAAKYNQTLYQNRVFPYLKNCSPNHEATP